MIKLVRPLRRSAMFLCFIFAFVFIFAMGSVNAQATTYGYTGGYPYSTGGYPYGYNSGYGYNPYNTRIVSVGASNYSTVPSSNYAFVGMGGDYMSQYGAQGSGYMSQYGAQGYGAMSNYSPVISSHYAFVNDQGYGYASSSIGPGGGGGLMTGIMPSFGATGFGMPAYGASGYSQGALYDNMTRLSSFLRSAYGYSPINHRPFVGIGYGLDLGVNLDPYALGSGYMSQYTSTGPGVGLNPYL